MFAAITGQGWAALAHPFNLEVNGVDRVASVQFPTIVVDMPGPGSNGAMTFEIEDPDSSIRVEKWDEVRFIEHAAVRPVTFGGFVQSRRFRAWAAGGRTITVRCVGYGVLLDRKAVPGWSRYWDSDDTMAGNVVSIVNRHGGRVTALSSGFADTTAERSVSARCNWYLVYDAPLPTATLRGMLERMLTEAADYTPDRPSSVDNVSGPAGAAYWVDAYARFRAHPDPHPHYADDSFYDAAFDGGTPGLELDLTGTNIVSDLEYEDEDGDRVTSAYVESGRIARGDTLTASATRILGTTTMAEGEYVTDNDRPTWGPGFRATVTHTSASTTDDLGRILLRGIDLFGNAVEESISPEADAKVTGSQVWDRILGVESQDWEANAGADSISVGHAKGQWVVSPVNGYVRAAALERAGDLEALIVDDGATTTTLRDAAGRGAIGASEGATARGAVTVGSDGPADIRPGMHLTVTAPQVEQDGSTDWRITSVRIRFTSQTYREYDIGYGGTVPAPSLARRLRSDRVKQALRPGHRR